MSARPSRFLRKSGNMLQVGIFNAKLRKRQVTWLPIEVEALSTGAAIKHFAPFIIQSSHATEILTGNRLCVQAYQKLMRGEFSSSSRVITLFSTASRYCVHIRHVEVRSKDGRLGVSMDDVIGGSASH